MQVVIVEDEKLAADKLHLLLSQIDSGIKVLKVLESVEDAVNWFANHPSPDLVFMDIQLDDGISFEIFESVKIKAPIIFTTAYDEYAIRAFQVNSVDYLLKPIELSALEKALRKYKTVFSGEKITDESLTRLVGQMSNQYKSRFFIKVGIKYQSIPVKDICCFFVEERNSFIQTVTGKSLDVDYSLDQLQKMVDPSLFFRINRNVLVHLNCIDEIISYSSSRLKLKLASGFNPDPIVSRDKVSEFKKWMDR